MVTITSKPELRMFSSDAMAIATIGLINSYKSVRIVSYLDGTKPSSNYMIDTLREDIFHGRQERKKESINHRPQETRGNSPVIF